VIVMTRRKRSKVLVAWGISTPKEDIVFIKARLKLAEALSKNLQEEGSPNAKENEKPNR
jgi:hypothetical protein